MKTFSSFLSSLVILSILFITTTSAQPVTNNINYQAVARNAIGNVLVSQGINIKIYIEQGTGGPVLYSERHNVSTNQFGLFTLEIGNGFLLSGNYNSINWSIGDKWIKVEMDPTGTNTTYTNMGESRFL